MLASLLAQTPPEAENLEKLAPSCKLSTVHWHMAARAACHVRLRCPIGATAGYARSPRASACRASSARLADSMIMMCQLAHHQAARGHGLVDTTVAGEVCAVRWDAHDVLEVIPGE